MNAVWFENIGGAVAAGTSGGAVFYALRWAVLFFTARIDKRQAELDDEHAELDGSWKSYRILLEQRIKVLELGYQTIEKQNRALRLCFEHVTAALIRVDHDNPALALAERLFAQAFPDDFSMMVTRLDRTTAGEG